MNTIIIIVHTSNYYKVCIQFMHNIEYTMHNIEYTMHNIEYTM